MNYRIERAARIINELDYQTLLDVGCRDGSLKSLLPESKEYYGNDLFQNSINSVNYVGDIIDIDFPNKFDCIVALDIIEHVDDPHGLVDRLILLSSKHVIISLPNTYDIQHKFRFVFKNSLSSQYEFGISNKLDRHRWLMNYDEINNFFRNYAHINNMKLQIEEVRYCDDSSNILKILLVRLLRLIGLKKSTVRTVYGVLTHRNHN